MIANRKNMPGKLYTTVLYTLGLFWIILNVLDAITTYIIITNGGIELNPCMRYVISLGWEWFFAMKLIGLVIIFPIIPFIIKKCPNQKLQKAINIAYVAGLLLADLKYGYVVYSHLAIISRLI